MKKYIIRCGLEYNVKASSVIPAVAKVMRAEKRRLKERSKEIGKRLSFEPKKDRRLDITVFVGD